MSVEYIVTIEDLLGNISTLAVDNISITERLSEELDSGVINIPVTSRKSKYARYSKIRIYMNNLSFGLILWGDEILDEVKGNTIYYSHLLTLIEPTKLLEKYTVPNLTFQQPLDGVYYTMATAIERLRDVSPVRKVSEITRMPFSLSPLLRATLDLLPAPQFFHQERNLRESLIKIFSYVNAVPRLTIDGVLEADFYNERGEVIEFTSTASYKESITAEDYATTLEAYTGNLISDKDENSTAVQTMSRTDVIGVRSDVPIMGDGNFSVVLPYNIYKVLKIESYVRMFANPTTPGPTTVNELLDLEGYWATKNEYDTLPSVGSDKTARKSHTIWYTPGTNKIDGLTTTWGAFGVLTAIDNILVEKAFYYEWPTDPEVQFTLTSNWYEYMFRITYIPEINSRIHIEREDISDIRRNTIVLGNINDSIVDAQNVTNNMFGRLQRMGLAPVMRGVLHTDPVNAYSLGSYTTDEEILTDREIIGFPDFIVARYLTTPKFNRVSQFISVDREFRPLVVSPTQRVVTRQIIYKEFIEVSFSETTIEDSIITNDGITQFMNIFRMNNLTTLSINVVEYMRTDDSSSTDKIIIPCVSIGGQSTMMFQFGFNSPNSAGNKLVLDSGQRLMKAVKYTDDEGRVNKFKAKYYNQYGTKTSVDQYIQVADNYPEADGTTYPALLDMDELLVLLDAPEILSVDVQLQVVPIIGTVGIIVIGLYLTVNNPLVINYTDKTTVLKVYESNTAYNSLENKKAKGTVSSKTISISGRTVSISSAFPIGTHWAIADTDGNLYFAVNQIDTVRNSVSFNFNRDRTGVVYGYGVVYPFIAEANVPFTVSGTAILEYTSRVYELNIDADVLFNIDGSATIEYTVREYSLQIDTDIPFSISGSAVISMTYREYTLQVDTIVPYSISGSVALEYTTREYNLQSNITIPFSVSGSAMLSYGYYKLDADVYIPFSVSGSAELTYVAPEYFTVDFYNWDGTLLISREVESGEDATPPTATRTGYTFDSWDGAYTNVTSDRYIVATFTINTYTVKFISDGTILSTQYIDYLDPATAPSNPTKTGYVFDGWDRSYSSITSNTNVYATYVALTFTVRFIIGLETWDLQTGIPYGGSATTPTTPSEPQTDVYYFTFDGWSGSYTNITSDTIVYGSFTEHVRTDVEWVQIVSGVQTGTECLDAFDVGDVLKVTDPLTCVYEANLTYLSGTDVSTLPPPCADGETYTLCLWNGSRWSCTNYYGVVTGGDIRYYECKFQE